MTTKQATTRRAVLTAGVVGVAAIPAWALCKRGLRVTAVNEGDLPEIASPKPGASAHLIPNVKVKTHDGRTCMFYDDLVRDRIVTINFMSVRGDKVYPVIDNLVKVQRLLGGRVGCDIFMYSVTVDPEHDTPSVLKEFAKAKGVGPGWTFVSGGKREVDFLRNFMFIRRTKGLAEAPSQGGHGPCCSVGLVRYGNERLCRWGSFPAKVTPEFIATRFHWIGFRKGDAPRVT